MKRLLALILCLSAVQGFLTPQAPPTVLRLQPLWGTRSDVYVVIQESPGSRGRFMLEASCTDHLMAKRTWVVQRGYAEFDALNQELLEEFGFAAVPPLPPSDRLTELEDYLQQLLLECGSSQVLGDFLDTPPDLTPAPLAAEVVDVDWRDAAYRRAGERDAEEAVPNPRSSAIAGAVVGGVVAGPLGAAVGSYLVPKLAEQQDVVGTAARGAGRATDSVLKGISDVDRDLHLTEKATQALSKTADKAKELDEELHLVEKAGKVAETTANAVKGLDRQLGVSTKGKKVWGALSRGIRDALDK
ncbi:unnamed protein product [Chrysoparadoxa australica]